jgi:hypothetical protein
LDLEKKELMFDIILNGKYIYFDKFKKIFDDDITKYITSDEMLIYLPTNADAAMIEYILKNYTFEQGQYFFYNYAINNENKEIKKLIYEYFVENHSDILIDNMSKYNDLIENDNK